MQVVNNNDSAPLTLAEPEAVRQFEASDQRGQAVFHPRVAAGQPAPDCVLFLEEIARFAITILEGRYTVRNGRRFPQEAKAVRSEFKRGLDLYAYVIAVAWFPGHGGRRGYPGRGWRPQRAPVLR